MSNNNQTFTAAIENFVNKTKENMLDVLRNSVKDVINDAETTIGDGGRMPVVTGFLRQSGSASLNSMPSGETIGEKDRVYAYNPEGGNLQATLGKMKYGDEFFYGWTAVYANRQDLYYGFLTSAAGNWSTYVNANAKQVRSKK